VRRLLILASAVVFFDTLFFAVLTPLLPHYVHELHMGKAGAGVLAAAYPAGALLGAVPSGIVAGRVGLKRSVVVGLSLVAVCTVAFGLGDRPWELDVARLLQGVASAFSWTGALGWLVSEAPPERRASLIGQAFAAAVGGSLFGPVVGGIASVAGIGVTFTAVAALSVGLVVWTASTHAHRPPQQQSPRALVAALRDPGVLGGFWLVALPSLLFGVLDVLAPLRLAALGFGAVAIGAVFFSSALVDIGSSLVVGRAADRFGAFLPLALGVGASAVFAVLLPWPGHRLVLAALVVVAGIAFGTLFTPAMALLTEQGERRGLEYGYSAALLNLAWAPGQALGSAGGGAFAHRAGDAAAYLCLAAVCALTLAGLWRSRRSTAWTIRSGPASSTSSSHIIDVA
jgi:MFS family permease